MNEFNSQSKSRPLKEFPVTTLLLASFIGLFAWQVMSGVDASNPTTADLLNWGANTLLFSVANEPWRLLTAGFLHIGLMHLMFNGFAMYYFGQVAEQMWGKMRFLLIFLLAVVGGNLLNCYVTNQKFLESGASLETFVRSGLNSVSAGASGGIMGVGAGLLICALLRVRLGGISLNLASLLMVMAINLSYGFIATGVDNAGHIGGALTGALLALVIAITWKMKFAVQSVVFLLTVLAICFGFYWVWHDLNAGLMLYLQG